jgi:hypothetical protein
MSTIGIWSPWKSQILSKAYQTIVAFGQSLRQCGIVSSMPRLYVLHDAYSPIWASYVPVGRPLLNINHVKTTTFLGREWCYNLPIRLLHCCSFINTHVSQTNNKRLSIHVTTFIPLLSPLYKISKERWFFKTVNNIPWPLAKIPR